jgi:hypothetical protein
MCYSHKHRSKKVKFYSNSTLLAAKILTAFQMLTVTELVKNTPSLKRIKDSLPSSSEPILAPLPEADNFT